jgi:hypothetical protein
VSNLNSTYNILLKRQFWGPLLIFIGTYSIFMLSLRSGAASLLQYTALGVGVVLILAGIVMMFWQLRQEISSDDTEETAIASAQPEHAVSQLSRNYELLRRQTTQGFILSGVFMSLGLLVILSGSAGQFFGFSAQGSNLTTVAGVIMEFISATSLLIYRLNFKRLNETSDRLDATWRVLTAHRLTESLPEDKKAEATLKLIDALIKPYGGKA